jgi:hypothetical protein
MYQNVSTYVLTNHDGEHIKNENTVPRWTFAICTSNFQINSFNFFSAFDIFVFDTILRINVNHIPIQNYPVGL